MKQKTPSNSQKISNNHDLSNNESAIENRASFYKEDISEANVNEKNIDNWDSSN